MKKVNLPATILANKHSGFEPSDRFDYGWGTGAANIVPGGPSYIAAKLCVEGANGPVELHAFRMSLTHDVYQSGSTVALSAIERVKGLSRHPLERRFVFCPKRVEESINRPLNLIT